MCSSSTFTKPAGSPLGETSSRPASPTEATKANGACSMNVRAMRSMAVTTLATEWLWRLAYNGSQLLVGRDDLAKTSSQLADRSHGIISRSPGHLTCHSLSHASGNVSKSPARSATFEKTEQIAPNVYENWQLSLLWSFPLRVTFGSQRPHRRGLLCSHERTSTVQPVRSEKCQCATSITGLLVAELYRRRAIVSKAGHLSRIVPSLCL